VATDPKIRYDIEAGIKGEADVKQLAATVRTLADSLDGDLKVQAEGAAAALQKLGDTQTAVSDFSRLKRETTDLGAALRTASGEVDRLGNEMPAAAAATEKLAAAEAQARTSAAGTAAILKEQRDALKALQAEYTGSARQTDAYRESSAQLRVTVRELADSHQAEKAAVQAAAAATKTAQAAEREIGADYARSVDSAKRLSAEVGNKTQALNASRATIEAAGLSTTKLKEAEQQLASAVNEVRANVVALAPAFAQAATASSASASKQAADQRTVRDGVKGIRDELSKIQLIAGAAVGGGFLGGMIKDVAATADEFKNLQARVKLATGEGDNFTTAFAGIQRIALATNSSLTDTGTLFTRLQKAATDAGLSSTAATSQSLALVQTINQAVQLSGSSAEASSAAITQLIQGLQSGVLRGDEFNSVMEQAPRLAQALAQGVGRTTGELRKLAEQGGLTTDVVTRALTTQAAAVESEFGKLPITVGRSLQNLQTQWQLYVGATDNGYASSANLARIINGLAGNLDTLVTGLYAAGKAWTAIKIAGLAADLFKWATATTGATVAIQANTVALAGNTGAHVTNAAAQRATALATVGTGTAMGKAGVQLASGSAILGRFSGLLGPFGIAVAAVTPQIIDLARAAGEGAAKLAGWGKVMADAEARIKQQEASTAAYTAAVRANAIALQEARDKQFELTKDAQGLIGKFDEMRTKGDSAAEAIGKIGKDFDLASVPGIANATAVLDKLAADGKISAGQFQQAWSDALKNEDLGVFETNARAAFSGAAREGERIAAVLNGSAREAIRRTGLDFDVLAGGISKASRSTINDTDSIIRNLAKLKAQGVDTGLALTASISKGIDTADSQKSIEALRGQIEAVRKVLGDDVADGLLSKLAEQAEEVQLKVDQLKTGIPSVTEAFKIFGLETEDQMKRVAKSTQDAYDVLKASGKATADQLAQAFEKAAEAAIKANKGVAPAGQQTERAVIRAKQEAESYGKTTSDSLNKASKAWKDHGEQVQRTAEDIGLDPSEDQRGKPPAIIDPSQQLKSTTGNTREDRLAGQGAVDNTLMFKLRDKLEAGTLGSEDAGSIRAVLAALKQNNQINGDVLRRNPGAISLEGQRDDAMWQRVGARMAQELARIERPKADTTNTKHEVAITTPDGTSGTVEMKNEDQAKALVGLIANIGKRSNK
jgi:tape measure domain-containing protein